MRNIQVMRGGSDNIHAQVKFDDFGWIDINKSKDDSPATLHIVCDDNLTAVQAKSLMFALNKAIDMANDFDANGTNLSLIMRDL